METNHKYALITGACSGLGRALARECGSKGYHLLLIDIPGAFTASFATDLEHHFPIKVKSFELDLTDGPTMQLQLNEIAQSYPVNFIINNAGVGGTCALLDTTLERIDQIIALNIRGTAMLTRIFVPYLLQRPGSFLLNVSSMAAFTPIAFKNVYPASKAFISSFTLGLRQELAGKGVSVSVLYPGSMMTNFSVSRRILSLGAMGRMGLLSTNEIAAIAVTQTLQGKAIIIPGKANRFNFQLLKWLPSTLKSRIVSKGVRKEIVLQPSY